MTFKTGTSGNPKGRPKGSRNKPKSELSKALLKHGMTEQGFWTDLVTRSLGGDVKASAIIAGALLGKDSSNNLEIINTLLSEVE